MTVVNNTKVPSWEDIIEMSGVETLHPGGFDLSKRIGEIVSFDESIHVLDVSSGKGTFACYYTEEFGSKVTGIDINEEFVRISRKKAKKKGISHLVDFKVGDSTKLPFPDNSFDVVVNECAVGLMAINNPQKVLDEMYRVLKPGGKIVIHESTWEKELPRDTKENLALKLGTKPFTKDEWHSMLTKSGVNVTDIEDWSGIENIQKMRPGHNWSPKRPHDFMTFGEKVALIPKIIFNFGLNALFELEKYQQEGLKYIEDGYYGYVLMVGEKRL